MPKPRDWLREPKQFGRVDPADWKVPVPAERPALAAAKVQHELVREARQQQVRMGQSTDETAQLVQMTGDQLRRIYRGESRLTLETMYRVARAVGVDLHVDLKRLD